MGFREEIHKFETGVLKWFISYNLLHATNVYNSFFTGNSFSFSLMGNVLQKPPLPKSSDISTRTSVGCLMCTYWMGAETFVDTGFQTRLFTIGTLKRSSQTQVTLKTHPLSHPFFAKLVHMSRKISDICRSDFVERMSDGVDRTYTVSSACEAPKRTTITIKIKN